MFIVSSNKISEFLLLTKKIHESFFHDKYAYTICLVRWLLQNVFFPYNSPHVIYNFFAVTISQNSLLAYLDNVLNGFFKYLIMITEFKIKCLTDRGLTKCYISNIIFYILLLLVQFLTLTKKIRLHLFSRN